MRKFCDLFDIIKFIYFPYYECKQFTKSEKEFLCKQMRIALIVRITEFASNNDYVLAE